MIAKFKTIGNELYIDEKKVLRAWESCCGWYWFATEKIRNQLSDLGKKKLVEDTIWYGYVQGFDEEWGYFSQAEIESLKPKSWEIPKKNFPYAGRRR